MPIIKKKKIPVIMDKQTVNEYRDAREYQKILYNTMFQLISTNDEFLS